MKRLVAGSRVRACGLLLAAGAAFFAFGGGQPAPASQGSAVDSGRNVIMITWDGVRLDEFLGQADRRLMPAAPAKLLPYFWGSLVPRGQLYGNRDLDQYMTIANPSFISLPAYQGIFAGSPQLCESNDCTRTTATTFPERLKSSFGWPKEQVATFASWEGLGAAVESTAGSTYVNAGMAANFDRGDAEEERLNKVQQEDRPPWDDARFDRYTWDHALRHLERHKPRFLYISLDDSDGWGHRVEYDHYIEALETYDRWLQQLVEKLASMGDYGRRTCLIVTTDHGRGPGDHWSTHSNGHIYSGLVLMYAGCPLAPETVAFQAPTRLTTHLDIRPSVEQLFGLEAQRCVLCGRSLVASLQPAALPPLSVQDAAH